MSDPLSPSSLAAVPEVRKAGIALDGAYTDFQMGGDLADWQKARDAYLAAIRDAVLSAERSRLLAQTPEAVVEEAEKAMCEADSKFFDPAARLPWEMATPDTQAQYRAMAEAALPVLLAPEVAKREQAERDAEEFERAFENAMDGLRLTAEEKEDVRQTPALNLSLKCNEAVNRAIVAERDRDHNERAVHVTREELRAAESRLAEVARERNEACDSFRVEAAKLAGAERELEGALSAIDRWSARASAAEAEVARLRGERDEFKRRLEEYEPLPECPECGRTDDHLHHFD